VQCRRKEHKRKYSEQPSVATVKLTDLPVYRLRFVTLTDKMTAEFCRFEAPSASTRLKSLAGTLSHALTVQNIHLLKNEAAAGMPVSSNVFLQRAISVSEVGKYI
jgi:hypothetical protein